MRVINLSVGCRIGDERANSYENNWNIRSVFESKRDEDNNKQHCQEEKKRRHT